MVIREVYWNVGTFAYISCTALPKVQEVTFKDNNYLEFPHIIIKNNMDILVLTLDYPKVNSGHLVLW